MIKYVPHKGSKKRSQESAVIYKDLEELIKEVPKLYEEEYFKSGDIVIKEFGHPHGAHSQTMVCVKRFGDDNYIKEYGVPQCIGYVEELNGMVCPKCNKPLCSDNYYKYFICPECRQVYDICLNKIKSVQLEDNEKTVKFSIK